MVKKIFYATVLAALIGYTYLRGQSASYTAGTVFTYGSSLPGTCSVGAVFVLNSGTIGLNVCTATNTWTAVTQTNSTTVPVHDHSNSGKGGQIVGAGLPNLPTSWTLRNSAVINDYNATNGINRVVSAHITDSGSLNWRFVTQPVSGNYTLIATIRSNFQGVNSNTWGLYLYDGTKVIGLEFLNQAAGSGGFGRLRVEEMNSVTSDSSTVKAATADLSPSTATLKIVKDSTNRTYYYYSNGAFVQYYQEAASTWLTETSVGFGGLSVVGSTAVSVEIDLIDWSLS